MGVRARAPPSAESHGLSVPDLQRVRCAHQRQTLLRGGDSELEVHLSSLVRVWRHGGVSRSVSWQLTRTFLTLRPGGARIYPDSAQTHNLVMMVCFQCLISGSRRVVHGFCWSKSSQRRSSHQNCAKSRWHMREGSVQDVCDLFTTTVACDPRWLGVTVHDRWGTPQHTN